MASSSSELVGQSGRGISTTQGLSRSRTTQTQKCTHARTHIHTRVPGGITKHDQVFVCLHMAHYLELRANVIGTKPDGVLCTASLVVTICTASLAFNISTFCPHSVFMCFVWIWEQTAIISLYSIDWLGFVTETQCVYCAVRSESLYVGKSKTIRTLFFQFIYTTVGLNKYVIFLHSLLPFRCTCSSCPQACVFPPGSRFSVGRATIYSPLPSLICP
jgi:hypothetical protein